MKTNVNNLATVEDRVDRGRAVEWGLDAEKAGFHRGGVVERGIEVCLQRWKWCQSGGMCQKKEKEEKDEEEEL